MAIVWDMAMTAEEFAALPLPTHPAWMSCRFSRTEKGLDNLPGQLPKGCLLICDDLYPIGHHDIRQIVNQLQELAEAFSCSGILLDFQRKDPRAAQIVRGISGGRVPVAVTEHYAKDASCAVFLSPPPLNIPLEQYFSPWKGREIFLECAPAWGCITVTEEESRFRETPPASGPLPFWDSALQCRYRTEVTPQAVTFHLHRDRKALEQLAAHCQRFGVTHAIGLYQELMGK